MTIRHMRIFLKVCEMENSVTRAAKALYMTQPSVSQAIRELEEHYGVRLFDRLSRRLYLTPAGDRLRTYAQRIIRLCDDMEDNMRDQGEKGLLRVGASMTVGECLMPDIAEQFQSGEEGERLQVLVDASRNLTAKLKTNELDLALTEISEYDEALTAQLLFSDELRLIVPPRFPYRQDMTIEAEKLAEYPLILREEGSGTRDIFERIINDREIAVNRIWETTSTGALIRAVSRGIGISFVPGLVACQAEKRGDVWTGSLSGVRFPQNFYLVYHRDKYLTKAAARFMGLVRECAGKG